MNPIEYTKLESLPARPDIPFHPPFGIRIQGNQVVTVYGGSFFHKPFAEDPESDPFFSINLMAEHRLPCVLHVPIEDYSVPKDPMVIVDAIEQALQDGRPLYVGCMGGIGRTGLFLACLFKALGEPSPIEAVREWFYEHAVETENQIAFVQQFPADLVRLPGRIHPQSASVEEGAVEKKSTWSHWSKKLWGR